MPHRLPTMTVESDNGPVLINASDYDPKVHKITEPVAVAVPAAPKAPVTPPKAPVTPPIAPVAVDASEYGTLTVDGLKEQLTILGVEDLTGKKADLLERLNQAAGVESVPANETPTLPEGSTVAERDGIHFIVDSEGNDVVSELVNAAGYETAPEAWAIVMPTTD